MHKTAIERTNCSSPCAARGGKTEVVSMTTGSLVVISRRDAICICTQCAHICLFLGVPSNICNTDQVIHVPVDDEVHACQLHQIYG